MIFIVSVFIAWTISEVTCNCTASVPQVKSFPENQTGLLWNITFKPSANWTYEVTKINNMDIPVNASLRQKLREHFLLLRNTSNSILSFSVQKLLNKEDQFWINVASGGVLSSIELRYTCHSGSNVNYIMTINVGSVNEYPQTFATNFPVKLNATENAKINTVVFSIYPYIDDKDIPKPEITDFSYSLVPTNTQNDGRQWFHIPIASSDEIKVKKVLDFDALYKKNLSILSVTIVVKAVDETKFSINRTVRIDVLDVDDLPPIFIYPGCNNTCTVPTYTAITGPKYRGVIRSISPVKIEAKDQDSLNTKIVYSIQPSPDNYHQSFKIHADTGEIIQTGDVSKVDVLIIKAMEAHTANKFYRTASLLVKLSNDTIYLPAASTVDNDNKMKIIAIIVGAISLIIIAVLIFLIIFVYKRTKKKMMISPGSEGRSPRTLSENLISEKAPSVDEKVTQWKQTISPLDFPVVNGPRNQLDPLQRRDESTETDGSSVKKKRPRKKKKRLMEIFDGTKNFEDQADPEFFQGKDKEKRKRSTKSKNKRSDNTPLDISGD